MEWEEGLQLRELIPLTDTQLAEELGYHRSHLNKVLRGKHRPRKVLLEAMRRMAAEYGVRPKPEPRRPRFRFVDLFAGIGGMRLAAESVGGQCVQTVEWNKFARQTYLANFPHARGHRFDEDITQLPVDQVAEHELLMAGFPCQPFSIAGVSKKNSLGRPHGFDCEEQGNLFFNIRDILDARRPPAFLLENVKNLKSHDHGRTFAVIEHWLKDRLGYHVHSIVLDAQPFVPQHRERIFIVGFREPNDFSWNRLRLPPKHSRPRLESILHKQDGVPPEPPYTESDHGGVAQKYVLTDHLWSYLQSYAQKHRALGNGFGFGLVGPADVSRTLSARYFKDGSEILIDRGGRRNPRRLTPRECARLMGFDSMGRTFRIPVSDTQAYRQFGNAVVPPVVAAVLNAMLPYIPKTTHRDARRKLPFVEAERS
jgi:DNA (cytosine-5)-methyltransferase 1